MQRGGGWSERWRGRRLHRGGGATKAGCLEVEREPVGARGDAEVGNASDWGW